MKSLVFVFALLGVIASGAEAAGNHGSVGAGLGILLPSPDSNPCPPAVLCINFDGSAENAYCWQYGGVVPPYYGAFAECCDFGDEESAICGLQLLLTGIGYPCRPLDAYVWADGGGIPGRVLTVTPGLNPCPVGTWPNISTHDLDIDDTFVEGVAWFGYWADFSSQPCGYFVAADTNGSGGCAYTNIAPGIGYPTGWNDVGRVWPPGLGGGRTTQSIGIGAWVGGGGVPVRHSTWGRIRQLYR